MKKELATFILLFVISCALIVLRIKVHTATELPQLVSSKLILLFHQLKSESGKKINSIVEATRAIEENRKLKEQITLLQQQVSRCNYIREENQKLRLLLGIKESIRKKSIPARVVGWVGEYWELRFVLDKGRADGVKEGMAVVGFRGIVGQIKKVFAHHSIAISNIDPDFSIHVEDYRSKVNGIARGNGSYILVDYILPSMDVKVGDILVSTGIGGVFPPGLYVARVISVKRSIEEKFLRIKAVPTDRIENNRYVLITGDIQFAPKKKG